MKAKTTLDMTSGPIFRKLFLYALPLMLRAIMNTLYSTVDKVVAGKCIGTAAMAAIGATNLPIGLLSNLISGLSLGVSVCCGNYIGSRKEKEFRECMHTALILGFLGGSFVWLLGAVVLNPLLVVMQTPENILRDARVYMNLRLVAYPIAMMNNFSCCVMNAKGDTKTPMMASAISGAVNVVFNFLFVLGFKMDIAGLAWATFLSHLTDTIIQGWVMFSKKGVYRITIGEFKIHKSHIRPIVSVGLPSGLSTMVYTVSGMILQSTINSFGDVVVAGNTAAGSCAGYVQLVLSSFGSACMCAVAQCFGAHNFDRIRSVVKKSITGSLGICLAMATVITVFARPMMRIFTDDPAVVEAGIPVVMFHCWGFMVQVFGTVYAATLRGLRKSSTAMLVDLISVCAPRVIWVLTVMKIFYHPIALYCVYPVSWLITAVLLGIAYRHHFKQLSAQTANAVV